MVLVDGFIIQDPRRLRGGVCHAARSSAAGAANEGPGGADVCTGHSSP
jgi:hypothetical protein